MKKIQNQETGEPLLQAALDLSRKGASVIPVGRDKKPLVRWSRYQQRPASSQEIEKWVKDLHPWGIGIVTGRDVGVLDIDGDQGFEALLKRGFQLPETLTARTPRGGSHFYFEDPGLVTKNFIGGTKSCPLPMVDFRGRGGYVIAPPTPGYAYVKPLPVAAMPDWLKSLAISGWSLVDEAIRTATDGTRNKSGFLLACKLRDHGFSEEAAKSLLLAFAKAVRDKGADNYTEDEALQSLASAYSRPAQPLNRGTTRRSQNTQLVELAAGTEFFHAPDQTAYATIDMGTHKETHALKSRDFERWLRKQYFDQTGAVPPAQPVADAICVFEGQAIFTGQECDVQLRVGEHEGAIIIDLCNPAWEVIVSDPTGWRIEKASPVKFRRTRGMLSLPTPVVYDDLNTLRQFVNVSSDDEWHLLVVWILSIMRPRGPYPVLCLLGEQGSGKSTLVRMIRTLTDPSVSPVRSEPHEIRDLLISARNSWLLAFDNLSHLSPWLSDALCRLSTGGGFATRELYSDANEIIIDAQRGVIVNGIEALITRSDLLDRSLLITLPTIEERERRSEADLLRGFEEARPRLFGALLTAMSRTLAALSNVRLERLPRMADFVIFGVACEKALGWKEGTFLAAYERNRNESHLIALEGSPIVVPIEELLANQTEWEGTATNLLQELSQLASLELIRRRGWPATERQLGVQLARLAPNLRAVGIYIEKERSGHTRTRLIHLKKVTAAETSSACPHSTATEGVGTDNGEDNHADKADKKKPSPAQTDCRVHPRLEELGKMWRRVKAIPNPDGVKHQNNHNDKGREVKQ
ncbi:MAG: hypothetical protein D4R81_05910 [Nitrospiraceae bacterium]|nr:MAG: hypothetical protein D4R81_05910 [Nitrospiraceae bacterium]